MDTVILLSGGLDSAAAAAYAVRLLSSSAVGLYVRYGSVHEAIEAGSARRIAQVLGIGLRTAWIRYPVGVDSALLRTARNAHTRIAEGDLCIVPMRNTLLLAMGAALAHSVQAVNLVYGAQVGDSFGYPDCRSEFVESMQRTIFASLERPVRLYAPLLYPDQTLQVLAERGYSVHAARAMLARADVSADVRGKAFSLFLLDILGAGHLSELSHSCYAGVAGGCGRCATCQLRTAAEQLYEQVRG